MNCTADYDRTCMHACMFLLPQLLDTFFATAPPFLEFGEGVGDAKEGGDDLIVASFNLSVPLVFYQVEQTEVFVSRCIISYSE